MSGPVHLLDGTGTKSRACVTSIGQLVVAPFAYDDVVAKTTAVDNVPINFYPPRAGYQFVITSILLTADSNVTGSSVIDVYEANDVADTVISKAILHIDLLKNNYRDITGMNIIVTEGKFVNLKADDTDVSAVITGYYVPA